MLLFGFMFWPVESYGDGIFWDVKRTTDALVYKAGEQLQSERTPEEWRQMQLEREARNHVYAVEAERHIFELTNKARAVMKLPPLIHDEELSSIAREHSHAMLKARNLNHVLNGEDPTDRMLRAGYTCGEQWVSDVTFPLSENIAMRAGGYSTNDTEKIARGMMQGWLDSWGHRENIMDSNARRLGVGIAFDGGDRWYGTQNFSECE